MLAQTQAARVAERFPLFMERFPDPDTLAAAPLFEVLESWSGLGYPRRARWLSESARRLVSEHGGEVPDRLEALMALPGIGEYTARAVLAFAFKQRFVPVDTNVARVLARAVAGSALDRPATARLAAELAGATADDFPLGLSLMDLGATLCRPTPHCERCPLSVEPAICRHYSSGGAGDPAATTWGRSRRQAPFEGSDRQGRGRLLAAAARGPLEKACLAVAAGWADDDERAARVADGLVADGLLERDEAGELARYRLPG